MATLTIDAAAIELGVFKGQWQGVREELETAGHVVKVERRIEQRGGPPPVDVPDFATIRVAVWVAKKLAGEGVEAVVEEVRAAVLRHLKGRIQGRRRKVMIVPVLNPRGGEPFAKVEVPVPDEDER